MPAGDLESRHFIVDDMEQDPRWPTWGPLAADLGLRSILATRLFTHGETHGALNLYSSDPRRFDEDDVAVAHVFGAHASVALAAARQEEHLRKAVDARHVIGQAQGILMERFDIDADRAFNVLRRYSQNRNVKLRAIAEEVVDHRTLAEPAMTEPEKPLPRRGPGSSFPGSQGGQESSARRSPRILVSSRDTCICVTPMSPAICSWVHP